MQFLFERASLEREYSAKLEALGRKCILSNLPPPNAADSPAGCDCFVYVCMYVCIIITIYRLCVCVYVCCIRRWVGIRIPIRAYYGGRQKKSIQRWVGGIFAAINTFECTYIHMCIHIMHIHTYNLLNMEIYTGTSSILFSGSSPRSCNLNSILVQVIFKNNLYHCPIFLPS